MTGTTTGDLSDVYEALAAYISGGPRPGFAQVEKLSGMRLQTADEHDVGRLLLLGALSARLDGGGSIARGLLEVARRYEDSSFLYTGRIIPRVREMIDILESAVDGRSSSALTAVADHLSQGWAAYRCSIFPDAFARLSLELGLEKEADAFTKTSFTCWQDGLLAAAANRPSEASEHFRDSLDRYRTYLYHADAAWLFTDVIITELIAGRERAAAQIYDEQFHYVEEVLAQYPVPDSGERHLFQIGDVQSGGYHTFVESATLHPQGLTQQDREVLRRYVRTSDFLLRACRYHSEDDFNAALDLFSFGWTGFPSSPYPHILQLVADRYGSRSAPWNVYRTAYARWHSMLRLGRAMPKSATLIQAAVELHERLVYAGMGKHAAIALLDAAVVHGRLHGTDSTAEWISRYVADLRPQIPDLLRAAVNYLQSGERSGADHFLTPYIGRRSHHTAPDLIFAGAFWHHHDRPAQTEVVLYGRLLTIEGVTVYEDAPEPLVDILDVLGTEFRRSRQEQRDVPLLSAAELSSRTGRTPAALAQAVRRFRNRARERFREATDWNLDPDTVIQGRPGYRLNPATVERFCRYPEPESPPCAERIAP